jgi:hypothetical protein
MHWAYEVTAIGEIVTLPLVVLVSFIAQPRLQYALAEDGLLPAMFGQVRACLSNIHRHTCMQKVRTAAQLATVEQSRPRHSSSSGAYVSLRVPTVL